MRTITQPRACVQILNLSVSFDCWVRFPGSSALRDFLEFEGKGKKGS